MMMKAVAQNLKAGGRFIAFSENPFFPVHAGIKYGVEVETDGRVRDGTKVKRIHYVGDKIDFAFEHYHFEPATYQRALELAGFTDIEWKNFVSADEPDVDADYWRDFLNDFSVAVLLCCKGA